MLKFEFWPVLLALLELLALAAIVAATLAWASRAFA
jgi:hypothetical protein